jgi:hypothetical protein
MSVSSSDLETTSANAPVRTPLLKLPHFALVTFLAVSVPALSLCLSIVALMAANQILVSGPGGPGWP